MQPLVHAVHTTDIGTRFRARSRAAIGWRGHPVHTTDIGASFRHRPGPVDYGTYR
jgi:hypothetical protein